MIEGCAYVDPFEENVWKIVPNSYAPEVCDICGKKRKCYYMELCGVPKSAVRYADCCKPCLNEWRPYHAAA